MDQLKPILEQVKKHHFWIISGVVALLCIVFGYLGTSDLAQKWNARASQIKGAFSTAEQVAAIQHHPNDEVAREMEKVNRQLAEEVFQAWQERFARQKELLVWPAELKSDFIKKVEKFQPIEATVPFPEPTNPPILNRPLRARYMNYIHNELPKLAERIGAKWAATGPGSGGRSGGNGPAGMGPGGMGSGGMGPSGMGPGAGMGAGGMGAGLGSGGPGGGGNEQPSAEDETEYVVTWNPANQSELLSRFDWSKNSDQVPSVLQILYAQEDLWILRSLMDIIAETNGDADAQYNAVVKEIDTIYLGAEAGGIDDGGDVMLFESSSQSAYGQAGAFGGGSAAGAAGAAGSAGMSNPYGSSSSQQNTGPDPADNRYVDAKYAPVKGSQLRSAFKSQSPNDAFLVVAKRMPVRMVLKVDVLKLSRLLAMCGNAKLTFEVRQVRINPKSKTEASGGSNAGGGFASGGGPAGMGSGMGGQMDLSGSGALGGAGGEDSSGGYGDMGGPAADAAGKGSPYDVEVEIYGLIYLYNPPQRSKLGLPEDAETPAGAGAAARAPAGG